MSMRYKAFVQERLGMAESHVDFLLEKTSNGGSGVDLQEVRDRLKRCKVEIENAKDRVDLEEDVFGAHR